MARAYSDYNSLECEGIVIHGGMRPDRNREAPYSILLDTDATDDQKGLLVVIAKGSALDSPIISKDQVQPGKAILFDITWSGGEIDAPVNLYATYDDFETKNQDGLQIVQDSSINKWKLSQFAVPYPEKIFSNERLKDEYKGKILKFVAIQVDWPKATAQIHTAIGVPKEIINKGFDDWSNVSMKEVVSSLQHCQELRICVSLDVNNIDHKVKTYLSDDVIC